MVTHTTPTAGQEALYAYLPPTLIEQWSRRPERPPLWGEWIEGSLMFCDISGFTAMSENLARLGKEGAELMVGVLNRFFERMIGIADEWGGAQMKFGGDAMLLFFTGSRNVERAAAAGLQMQEAMREFRRLMVAGSPYRLRMRVAIHSGRFFAASVGEPQDGLHYLLVGPDVNATAEIEGAGQPGQVVLSMAAAGEMGPGAHLAPAGAGVRRVRRLDPPPDRPARRDRSPGPDDVLRRYVLPPLSAPLVEGRLPSFSGEHRRVTAVFINVLGISELLEKRGEAEALAQADTYVRAVMTAMRRNGGFLAASDVAQHGDKLICLFGAPVLVERQEAAALRACMELQDEIADAGLDLTHRIGVNSGFVFAGEVGSSRRREYTVIGDSVNLAARLMAAARPGEVLASRATAERAAGGFHLRPARPIRVKGKSKPVHLVRVQGTATGAAPADPARAEALVGRDHELRTVLRAAKQAAGKSRTRWTYISGEPGIGKSRLTSEVRSRLTAEGWDELTGASHMHLSHAPFAVWREPLRTLLGIDRSEPAEEAWAKAKAGIEAASPRLVPFAFLVAELLSLPVEPESAQHIEPGEASRYLGMIVSDLLARAASERPQLLVFEDLHWADPQSLELLGAVLARKDIPLLAVVTSRDASPPAELAGLKPSAGIALQELGREAAESLVANLSGIAPQDAERILSRAQGNPLFLQEIARGGWTRADSLPESVNDVILARLDRLPPEEKSVLRYASVIGPSFSLEELHSLLGPAHEQTAVAGMLEELSSVGFIRAQAPEVPVYSFAHVLTRDVAYETMPYAQRRQLHRRAAHHIERRDQERLQAAADTLLYHYELAGDHLKVARYAAMAGDRASAVFALAEAQERYRRALDALASAGRRSGADRSVLLERIGDCLETAGQYRDAAERYKEALEEWQNDPRRPRIVSPVEKVSVREAALSRKIGVSLERGSDYDSALAWIDAAVEKLPPRAGPVGAKVAAAKSLVLARKGVHKEAIEWGRRAVQTSRRDPRLMAYTHTILAISYTELGRLKEALRHDRMAMRRYHETGDILGQAWSNTNLGLSYQMLGVLDAALYHYQVGLDSDEKLGNTSHAAVVHTNMAEVLLMEGRTEEAIAHLQEVLSAYKNNRGLAGVTGLAHVNLSRAYQRKGQLDSARSHLRSGLRLLRQVGAQGPLLEAQLQRAELRLETGRTAEARRECVRILKVARRDDARLLEARAGRILGRAEASLGELKAAAGHLDAAAKLAAQIGAGYERALALLELADVRAKAGANDGAARLREKAERILSRMGAAVPGERANLAA